MGRIKGVKKRRRERIEIKIDSVGKRWEEDTSRGISSIPREENKIKEKSEKTILPNFSYRLLTDQPSIKLPDQTSRYIQRAVPYL